MSTYWEDAEFAFRFEETSGTRASTYGSDVMTEVGGTINRIAAQDGFGIDLDIGGPHGEIANRSGIQLGPGKSWTIDGFLTMENTGGSWVGILQKGTELSCYWGASNINLVIDGETIQFTGIGNSFAGYLRISYDDVAKEIKFQLNDSIQTVSHDWVTAAGTDQWMVGAGGPFGTTMPGWWDELAFFPKVLTPGRVGQRLAGKYISAFHLDPPDLSTARTWIQCETGQAFTHTPVNAGGTITSWSKISGTYPAGVNAINAVTGVFSGTPSTDNANTSFVFRATGPDGTSDWLVDFFSTALYGAGHVNWSPGKKVEATRNIGVFADKANDPVTQVSIVIDGGSPTVVTSEALNPDSGNVEWFMEINPASYSSGLHTYVATISHLHGVDLVVASSFVTDNADTFTTLRTRYVDPVSGNDSNAGTIGSPKRTCGSAIQSIHTLYSEVGGSTIYIKGDNDWVGATCNVTCNAGRVAFKAWPGEAANSCRFLTSTTNLARHVLPDIEDIDVLCDLNAENSDGLDMCWSGNTRFDGPGRTTGDIQGISGNSWPGGTRTLGRKCAAGDEASNWVVWRNNPRGPSIYLMSNTIIQRIGNQALGATQCGDSIIVDTVDANGTDDSTGNPFHNDGIQISFTGGRYNGYYNNIYFGKTRVSFLFHRNGNNEFVPTTDVVLKNCRYDDDDFDGGKYLWASRPIMGWKIVNNTAPLTTCMLSANAADFGGRKIRQSHVQLEGNIFGGYTTSSLGYDGTSTDSCDKLVLNKNVGITNMDIRSTNSFLSTNADIFQLATAYDYRVLDGSVIDRTMDRLSPRGLNNAARNNFTSIGAYASSTESGVTLNPPIIPPTGEYFAVAGVEKTIDLGAQDTGGPPTSASLIDLPGTKPAGATISAAGLITFTVP
jgi:hypothetical protein